MNIDKADLAMRLHSVAIRLLRTVRVDDARLGLSPARLSVLSILVFGGRRTLGQLTAAEQVAAPTMSKLVSGLERDGYARREGDASDGRVWYIYATGKAKRMLREGRQRRVERLSELLRSSPDREWRTLSRALAVLEGALAERG